MTARAYVLLQFILFGTYLLVPRWLPLALPGWLTTAGWVLALCGIALVAWSSWKIRKALTVLPVPLPETRLLTDGPFRYVRHPIYSGLLLAAWGYALYTAHPARGLVTLVLGGLLWHKAAYEERLLALQFPDYPAYVARSGRLWPGGSTGAGEASE